MVSDTDALQIGCALWRARDCDLGPLKKTKHLIPFIVISNYDPEGDGIEGFGDDSINNDGTLREACKRILYGGKEPGDNTEAQCDLALRCQEYCCGFKKYKTIKECVEKEESQNS